MKSISSRKFIAFARGDRDIVDSDYFPAVAFIEGTEKSQLPGCKPKCVGCQETYSRSWSVRCLHESKGHDSSCFITLTFNDKYLPANGLDHRWFQLFLKRFRDVVGPIRYYMAGEYGHEHFRPHFHALIFGFDFPDRKMFTVRDDVQLDTSEMLSSIWSVPMRGSLKDYPVGSVRGESFGFCSVGDLSARSAAYVARYVGKKINGDAAAVHYDGRKPEYVRMSTHPGIGRDWFLSYKESVFPHDYVVMNDGGKCKPPRYYDKIFELHFPNSYVTVKKLRKQVALLSSDNSPERLRDREIVKSAQFKQLKRSL